jgi:hypothetical protein
MNVSELFELTNWIQIEIVDRQIPQKYQTLQQILQRNAQPNQQKQPFEEQKYDLIETIRNVRLNQLTKDQLEFLRNLNIAQAVGKEGVETIEDILYKNVLDIATAAQKIQEIYQRLTQGIQKANQIKSGLEGCVIEEEYEIEEGVLIRIYFRDKASLANVTDFKKWGGIWHEIGRGIAMAHNATPEDVKIVGATSGSIVLEMATTATIASTASIIMLSILKVVDKVLEIRKKAEEIKNLKLNNKKIASELEREAKNEIERGAKKISTELIKKLGLNQEGEGDKINALEKAVSNLLTFIELGGEVDFIIPEEEAIESEEDVEQIEKSRSDYTKIKDTAERIRQLENKIKALEAPKDEDEPT